MGNLHSQDYIIKLKQGLAASINATATKNSAVQGEPHYTTDTKELYIFDGTNNEQPSFNSLKLLEKAFDPPDPAEGGAVIWMSNGVASGDDGDILIKVQAGGVVKHFILVDFSADTPLPTYTTTTSTTTSTSTTTTTTTSTSSSTSSTSSSTTTTAV